MFVKCSSNLTLNIMTTFQFILKNTTRANGEKSIAMHFIKDRKNTSLSLYKSCLETQWDNDTERVKKNHPDQKKLNTFIEKYKKIAEDIIEDFESQFLSYTLPDLVNKIKNHTGRNKTSSYTEYQNESIENLRNAEKVGSADIEEDTLRSLQKFFKKNEIGFNEITFSSLRKYETFLLGRKNRPSTIGIRMRTIRLAFNNAISAGVIKKTQYPFSDYKISKIKDSSMKEILDKDEIQLLNNYVPTNSNEKLAKDVFLFSYYSRGINFIDLIQIRKRSVNNDIVSYIRAKTGVPVNFKFTDKNKSIAGDYESEKSSYFLFNFIKNNNTKMTYLKNKCHKKLTIVNKALKIIMEKLLIEKHITFYCARHSFATALKFENISVDIIKEALGHKDIQSTMSYLKTLPDSKLNKIIEDIIV